MSNQTTLTDVLAFMAGASATDMMEIGKMFIRQPMVQPAVAAHMATKLPMDPITQALMNHMPGVRRQRTTRRVQAALVLDQLSYGQAVVFTYNGTRYRGTVNKINQTRAKVMITSIEGHAKAGIRVGEICTVSAGLLKACVLANA